MTQVKIELRHQTLKNRNDHMTGDLEVKVCTLVAYHIHLRYHESLDNLTPAEVYFGRGQTILLERGKIKRRGHRTPRLATSKNTPPNLTH